MKCALVLLHPHGLVLVHQRLVIFDSAIRVYESISVEVLDNIEASPAEVARTIDSLTELCFEVNKLIQSAAEGFVFDSKEAKRLARGMLQARASEYDFLEGKNRALRG